jgi:3D (Asp-Asp-Asp) domain-containing protein
MLQRIALLLLAAAALSACQTSRTAAVGKGKRMTIRTTAYTAAEPGGAHAATGERLHFGGDSNTYSAASDWSWMPLGTRFKILENGRTCVIEDYGSALVGRKTVDLFMPNGSAMRQWGCKNVEIEILEWGSPAMSLKLLQPRQKNTHVRTMVAELEKRGVKAPQGPLIARQ